MIPRRGLRIGEFRGIAVYLHWSWFIIFFLLLWVITQFFQANVDASPLVYVPVSLLTTFLFFVSVLLHELSHSLVANRNGVPIRRITLFVFGGVAQMSRDVNSPGTELKMAVAGPVCSYCLCLVFGLFAYLSHAAGAGTISFGFILLSAVNFGLGTFNLVPGFPLDGGRILRSLLWRHWGDLERSTRAATRMGEGVGGLLILLGAGMFIFELMEPQYDLFISGLWFILIGAFLMQAAYASYRQVRLRTSLEGLRVADATRFGVPAVDTSTTLEEVYKVHLERAPLSTIPVLRQGRLAGTVNLADLRPVPRHLWPDTPVGAVARPVHLRDAISPEAPLYEAVHIMERAQKEYLWVAQEGRLVGVILREDAGAAARRKG